MADSRYYIARCNLEFVDSETDSTNCRPFNRRFYRLQSFNGLTSDGCVVVMSPAQHQHFSISFDLVVIGHNMESGWCVPSAIHDVLMPSDTVFCGTDKMYYITSGSRVLLAGGWAQLLYRDTHLLPAAPGIPPMASIVQIVNACLGGERRSAQWTS